MQLRTPAILATAAGLAIGAAACGEDSTSTGDQGSNAAQTQAAKPEPVAQIDQLSGRSTAVELDSGFVGALESLKLAPGTVGDASIDGATASFPITGGNVTYYEPGSVSPYVQGEIDHDGSGLSLKGGGKTVRLTDFIVDPGASVLTGKVTVDGKEAAADAPLFFLDGGTLEPLEVNEGAGTAVLQGTTVELKAEAADLLNETFGVTALQEGLMVGTATITLNTAA